MSRSVSVQIDGRPVMVPGWVGSHWAMRGALGVPRGLAVGTLGKVEHEGEEIDAWVILSEMEAWEFHEGDRYRTFGFESAWVLKQPGEDDEDPADWWKRRS